MKKEKKKKNLAFRSRGMKKVDWQMENDSFANENPKDWKASLSEKEDNIKGSCECNDQFVPLDDLGRRLTFSFLFM